MRRHGPDVAVLEDRATLYRAIAAGARGYVPKTVRSEEIGDRDHPARGRRPLERADRVSDRSAAVAKSIRRGLVP